MRIREPKGPLRLSNALPLYYRNTIMGLTLLFPSIVLEIPQVTTNGVDPAIAGDNITLNCSATGDSPLVYQWTMQGSSTVLNSDNTTGILALMDITASDFGTYVCEVSNDLGMATSDVILEEAGIDLTFSSIIHSFLLCYLLVKTLGVERVNLAVHYHVQCKFLSHSGSYCWQWCKCYVQCWG